MDRVKLGNRGILREKGLEKSRKVRKFGEDRDVKRLGRVRDRMEMEPGAPDETRDDDLVKIGY